MMVVLETKHIRKAYTVGGKTLPVLVDINLAVNSGDFITVMGPSGSGKSTLLNIVGSLDQPDGGSLLLCGEDITRCSSGRISSFRNKHIGFVFQFHHLLPEFTALENVLIPARIAGWAREKAHKARELLEYFGLEQRMDHFPSQLSGGERQRLALCRALINQPDLLLMDEPTGNLDTKNAERIVAYIKKICHDLDQTVLLTTHNPIVAKAGHIHLNLENGTLVTIKEFENR